MAGKSSNFANELLKLIFNGRPIGNLASMSKPPRKFPSRPPPNGINNSSRDYRLPANALLVFSMWTSPITGIVSFAQVRVATAITNGHSLSNRGSKVMVLPLDAGRDHRCRTADDYDAAHGDVAAADLLRRTCWGGLVEQRCRVWPLQQDNSDHPWAVPTPANIPLVFAAGGGTPHGRALPGGHHALYGRRGGIQRLRSTSTTWRPPDLL